MEIIMEYRILKSVLLLCLCVFSSTAFSNDEEFPNRELYPEVPYISIDDLYKQKNNSEIVDVRSAYEYETLRIKGARNIPLNSSDFIERIKTLRSTSNKPIVFYCNGKTCKKSYKATRKALKAQIQDVVAYDAGIFDWAKKYPSESELLGKSPIRPDQLISSKQFKAHLLDHNDFIQKAGKNAIILDIRDPTQREGLFIFNGSENPVSMDNAKMQNYIDMAKNENRTLMIYDAVGKQVRWLQYYLEDQNLKSYYFMKGGAKSFFDELLSNYQ